MNAQKEKTRGQQRASSAVRRVAVMTTEAVRREELARQAVQASVHEPQALSAHGTALPPVTSSHSMTRCLGDGEIELCAHINNI